jgi:hypothetical protein
VRDQFLGWTYLTQSTALQFPYLYALSNQEDYEGPKNKDIYAAFNRTVLYRSGRIGTGVGSVVITLNTL